MVKNGDVLPYDLQGILNGILKGQYLRLGYFLRFYRFYNITNPNHEKQ